MFRTLRADEIDARIAQVKETGVSLLLYKDARCDMNILDETFGAFGWERNHEVIDGRLYCTVKIKDPDSGEWISKQDVGTESYTEKEKGQASDSFKRACFNWGIGRELYTAPFIWVNPDKVNIKGGKTYDKFCVEKIEYNKNKIVILVIRNITKGCIAFTWESPAYVNELVSTLLKEMERTGITEDKVTAMFKVNGIGNMNVEMLQKALKKMAKTPDKEKNENSNTDTADDKKE